MDYLLCEEVWLSSPTTPDYYDKTQHGNAESYVAGLFYTTKEDCEEALSICLQKELSYIPEPGYIEHLQSKNLLFARFREIQWLIKCRSRLNLSSQTVFRAVNYLDRFISMNPCNEWKYWNIELLSVACLSVAAKFSETSTPLHEIQMEDMDHSFQSITIKRMELMLLQALEWRLCSTTAYSYVELLTMNFDSLQGHLRKDLVARITELLLGSMLDSKLVQYRPSIVAASALWCSLEELVPSKLEAQLTYFTGFFYPDQKDNLDKCHKIMRALSINKLYDLEACGNSYYCPSSPVTVLLTEQMAIIPSSPVTVLLTEQTPSYDGHGHVDRSLFKMSGSEANTESKKKKRKREEKERAAFRAIKR